MRDKDLHGLLSNRALVLYKTILLLLVIRLQFFIRTEDGISFFDNGIVISYLLIGLCCISFNGQYLRYATLVYFGVMAYALIDNTFYSIQTFTSADVICLSLFIGLPAGYAAWHYRALKVKPTLGKRELMSIALMLAICAIYLFGRSHREYFPPIFNLMGWHYDPIGTVYYQSQAFTEVLCSILVLANVLSLDFLTAIYHLMLTLHNYINEVAGDNTKATMVDWEVVGKIHIIYIILLGAFLAYHGWKKYRQQHVG